MNTPTEPRRIELDGMEVVVIALDDYERLDGYRRQLGGQSKQIQRLKQQVLDLRARLDDLQERTAGLDCRWGENARQPNGCVRETLLALLASGSPAARGG